MKKSVVLGNIYGELDDSKLSLDSQVELLLDLIFMRISVHQTKYISESEIFDKIQTYVIHYIHINKE